MFCALMDRFTPRIFALSIEEDNPIENDWILGHSKKDREIFDEIRKDEFFVQLDDLFFHLLFS